MYLWQCIGKYPMIHICFNRLFPFDPLNSILCCTCTCINIRGNYVHLYKIVCFSILYTYLRSFFKIIFSFQSSFIQYISFILSLHWRRSPHDLPGFLHHFALCAGNLYRTLAASHSARAGARCAVLHGKDRGVTWEIREWFHGGSSNGGTPIAGWFMLWKILWT